MKNFNKLIQHFIETEQLGHYDRNNYSITLYDIENSAEIINRIKADIEEVTKNYRLIVTTPDEMFTNVNILDIDL